MTIWAQCQSIYKNQFSLRFLIRRINVFLVQICLNWLPVNIIIIDIIIIMIIITLVLYPNDLLFVQSIFEKLGFICY